MDGLTGFSLELFQMDEQHLTLEISAIQLMTGWEERSLGPQAFNPDHGGKSQNRTEEPSFKQ